MLGICSFWLWDGCAPSRSGKLCLQKTLGLSQSNLNVGRANVNAAAEFLRLHLMPLYRIRYIDTWLPGRAGKLGHLPISYDVRMCFHAR